MFFRQLHCSCTSFFLSAIENNVYFDECLCDIPSHMDVKMTSDVMSNLHAYLKLGLIYVLNIKMTSHKSSIYDILTQTSHHGLNYDSYLTSGQSHKLKSGHHFDVSRIMSTYQISMSFWHLTQVFCSRHFLTQTMCGVEHEFLTLTIFNVKQYLQNRPFAHLYAKTAKLL